MASQTLIFILPSIQSVEIVKRVKTIARISLQEFPDAPDKFKLAIACADKMLMLQGINPDEFMGFVDTIGGYYAALNLYKKNHCKDEDDKRRAESDLLEAGDFMAFASQMVEQATGVWAVELAERSSLVIGVVNKDVQT